MPSKMARAMVRKSKRGRSYNERFHPEIVKVYEDAGLEAPFGRGLHTLAFHRLAVKFMKQGLSRNKAYEKAMGILGEEKAVNPEHRRKGETK